jgi:4-hydroxythreonine-4-phosphate dehydrogenase
MSANLPVVVLADMDLLNARKQQLNINVDLMPYQGESIDEMDPKKLYVYHQAVSAKVTPGVLEPANSGYVLRLIETAAALCMQDQMSAMVTAPVHKAIINEAGIDFTGHTEYLANLCSTEQVVMMLACETMRVALVTTHLPLAKVAKAITPSLLTNVIEIIDKAMRELFSIEKPMIVLSGLNPHAGENGYLGREEIDVIEPVIQQLSAKGLHLSGPIPADTLFCTPEYANADVYLTMYHDQGLPVIKYAGFHHTANVTLGLPIIRTSVDHGTALPLAGTGKASPDSLIYATQYAWKLVQARRKEV